MKLTLAIDTTGKGGSVALAAEGRVRARAEHDPATGYAESLFALFDEVLGQAGASREDLHRIAVVEGPGSFTGLRVGVMTAKTLARARGWELWTANSLELALPEAEDARAGTAVAVEAGRGHLWVAAFLPGGEGWKMRSDIERVARDDLEEWTATQGVALVSSSNPVDAGELLSERLARRADRGIWPARRVDPGTLVPLYTAPSQAERAHGLDLGEAIHRPTRPVSWED